MRLFRPLSAALATTVIVAGAFTGPAAAQAPAGVGTSLTSTKVLTAQLGENGQLLDLLLLGDEARSTVDPAVAVPEAFSKLTALTVKTPIVPGNPVNQTIGVAEARSDGKNEVPIAAVDFEVPALPAQVAPVLSGTIDTGKLTASLTNGVAASGLNTSLTDIKAVGGLISLGSLKSTLDSSASGATASGLRGATVSDLTVLDLGALLQGLGLPLGELTPAQLVALVDALAAQAGLPLPSGADTLAEALTQLNAAITDLESTLTDAAAQTQPVTQVVDATTKSLLGTVGGLTGITVTLPTDTTTLVEDVTGTITALVTQLQTLVNDLYAKGLQALDNLSLLKLEGVEVGVTTKAVDTVEGSVAQVTGKIGKVMVGGVALPGIDLASAVDAVNANVANINTKLGEVLAIVDPGLANVVKVSVLDKATSVVSEGGYVRSKAGITAASASITPPANLAAIVKSVTDQVGVVQTLAGSTVPVPAVSALMNDLAASLNLATSALTSPAKVSVASVLSASDFKVGAVTTAAPGTPGAPGSTPTLPRTGGGLDLFLFGGLAAILALAVRRFSRPAVVEAVRIDR